MMIVVVVVITEQISPFCNRADKYSEREQSLDRNEIYFPDSKTGSSMGKMRY